MMAVVVHLDTISEHLDDVECPTCGYNAMIRLRGYFLGTAGVHMVFDQTFCGRCNAEKRRLGREAGA
ncbi:hypothetical protein [Microbacterium sp. p3-SID131]|uniref:hypothetical protein n=1 Tax=Microbacterium sp. p3-SID131 TaxID=2916215 RepID=UPI0021A3C0D9|nr:hypothetical protein [Microbacterium sp. p3-SID131]MCT1363950.1 hypothetical protein [Microbacterium sp. p3-SID131]